MLKTLAASALLLALAACASSGGGSVGNRMDWRCANGAAFSARILSNGNAEVFAGGQVYRLPHVTGGGARYSNGSVEYVESAGSATLHGASGGPYTGCRR